VPQVLVRGTGFLIRQPVTSLHRAPEKELE
jgi:hypothetical protein